MTWEEKALARIFFKEKVYKSDGQAFEDLFTSIMNYAEKGFKSVKPWGNIGDRKNDGYIKSTGTFYQVYAPENVGKSYRNIVNKIHEDFNGLIKQWSNVKKFYFVINDKYKGVNPDAEQQMQQIERDYNLESAEILTAKDIENILFDLDDDQIINIVGMLPYPNVVKDFDYNILNEVIEHIMSLPITRYTGEKIVFPDWEEKIKYNNLSEEIKCHLDYASVQLVGLDTYLSNNGNFLANSLRNKLNEVYNSLKNEKSGDELFFSILEVLSPRQQRQYQYVVITIMSKYFESCDIFEEPKGEKK